MNHINTTKTTRYHIIGKLNKNIDELWIVLHGYGQLAEYFIKKFEPIKTPERVIVAPEALNRFYVKGFHGRVGASWMTKEDRVSDIEDNNVYLEKIYKTLIEDIGHPVKTYVLGFSQGGPTALRWIANMRRKIDRLILWASLFPPDLDIENDMDFLRQINMSFVFGNEDEFITNKEIETQKKFLITNQIEALWHVFKGKHEVSPHALIDILGSL